MARARLMAWRCVRSGHSPAKPMHCGQRFTRESASVPHEDTAAVCLRSIHEGRSPTFTAHDRSHQLLRQKQTRQANQASDSEGHHHQGTDAGRGTRRGAGQPHRFAPCAHQVATHRHHGATEKAADHANRGRLSEREGTTGECDQQLADDRGAPHQTAGKTGHQRRWRRSDRRLNRVAGHWTGREAKEHGARIAPSAAGRQRRTCSDPRVQKYRPGNIGWADATPRLHRSWRRL